MKLSTRQALLALVFFTSTVALADFDPDYEYRNRIKVAETVQPLGETPFGEEMNLYKGGLSFRQVDISYPGQGPTIQLSRSYAIGSASDWVGNNLPAGDWDLSIPRIETVVTGSSSTGAWQVDTPSGVSNQRCSNFGPVTVYPYVELDQPWWNGYQLITEDGQSRPLLLRDAGTPTAPINNRIPSGGAAYPAVTADNWVLSCIPIGGNASNEGFLATSPDGTQYTFNLLVYGESIGTLSEVVDTGSSASASTSDTADSGTATTGAVNRPDFPRHLQAILYGINGGVNEQQAIHGRVQG